jgi:hypothetical protein
MLDDGWSYMDTFATLSFDLILSIYICMLCGNICNKLSNVAANFFFENRGKITMWWEK